MVGLSLQNVCRYYYVLSSFFNRVNRRNPRLNLFWELTFLASCHAAKMDDFRSRMQATKQTEVPTTVCHELDKIGLVKHWKLPTESPNGKQNFVDIFTGLVLEHSNIPKSI